MTKCTICEKPLTDLETFGDWDTPMCWEHWSSLMFDNGCKFSMYDWGELQRQEWKWMETVGEQVQSDEKTSMPKVQE